MSNTERDDLVERLARAEGELQRLHSWAGLMELLDEHWPERVWPTLPDSETRDTGARLVSLLRWVEQLSASVHCRSVERDAAVNRAKRAEAAIAAVRERLKEWRTDHDLGEHPPSCLCVACDVLQALDAAPTAGQAFTHDHGNDCTCYYTYRGVPTAGRPGRCICQPSGDDDITIERDCPQHGIDMPTAGQEADT